MAITKRPYRKRTFKRRPSTFRKAVATIAKRVVYKQAETKTYTTQLTQAFGTSGYLYDLWNLVSTGTGQSNRIGDDITALGVRIRGLFEQTSGVITALQSQNAIRLMFVVGKRPLVIGDMPSMRGGVDPELMTVLKEYYINFHTTKLSWWKNFYVKMNRHIRYDAAGAVVRCPIYMYVIADGGTGLIAGSGDSLSLQIQRYFKDI